MSTSLAWNWILQFLESYGRPQLHVEIRTSYKVFENCKFFWSLDEAQAQDESALDNRMTRFKRHAEGFSLRVRVLVSKPGGHLATVVLVDHSPFRPEQN